ncbi:MAG TPA: hypothetical protein VHI77_09610 [Solirubrobacterales bacterium]|jgi:hypothetical protein|nr:hypothetical protein [Solirubrobacterales bacterium]
MKGKLKALGLALTAMFALGALLAQSAQAVEHTFNLEAERTVLTGGFDPGFKDKTKIGNVTLVCNSAKFEGTAVGKTNDEITLTPTYGSTVAPSGCSAEGTGTEFIKHTNHCAYKLDSDTVLTPGTTEEHAPLEIECSGEAENEITLTLPSIGVTIHTPAQKPADGVVYTNIGTGSTREITVHMTLKNLRGKCTGVNCFLIGLTNGGEFTTAECTGTETIAGFEDKGTEQTGTEKTTPILKEGAQVGVFLTTP